MPAPIEADFEALLTEFGIEARAKEKIPRTLYHYTNDAGLIGIIQNSELWATNYKFLNDRTELRWASSLARGLLEKELTKRNVTTVKRFLERVLSEVDELNHPFDAYLLCLSYTRDSLSQWRAYGGKRGYCLGLDAKVLAQIDPEQVEYTYFAKVEYDRDTQLTTISNAITKFKSLVRRSSGSGAASVLDMASFHFRALITELSLYYKHPAFVAESEWRMVLVEPLGGIRFRGSARGVCPYVSISFPLGEVARLPLKLLRVGPGGDAVREQAALEALLRQNGHSPDKVYFSSAPWTG